MKTQTLTILTTLSSSLWSGIQATESKQPNILCIVCEDISPYLGCYGDPVAVSPNLDRFASDAIRFTRMYTPVGVSAPSRAALITGMYPTSIGANYMRNLAPQRPTEELAPGITHYEVVLPEGVKCYTEYLRKAGYYCTNNDKTDYQFVSPLSAWDECNAKAHWKNRAPGQPFFSVFNLNVTHESQIWKRAEKPLAVNPSKVVLPPYFPEDPIVRKDMAIMYSNIAEMDRQFQKLLDEMEQAGLADNTIVIFYSDNGGPLPRGKRAIYESGTLVPFMVRFPDGYRKGESENRLCSFVDIPPTILSLANIRAPHYMQGEAFLGHYAKQPRQYVFGARNRMDECVDKSGYVRDARFRYIRNYMPERANYMPIAYRLQMPMMRRILELKEEGKLNPDQLKWFESPRPQEEFYDVTADPHELHNLINDPSYAKEINRLRKAYNQWNKKYNAMWKLTEKESKELFWPNGKQRQVEAPTVQTTSRGVVAKCATPGATICYTLYKKGTIVADHLIYQKPITLLPNESVSFVGVRVGYKNSLPTTVK